MADEPVTVTTAHRVTRGRENDFRAWATGVLRDAANSEEYLGGGILSPGDSGGDWHIVYRWSSESAARRWEVSAVYAEWTAQAVRFTSPAGSRLTSGVRAWFDLSSRTAPPPKWKTATVTLTAVFPAVLLFNVTLIPFLGGLSVIVRTLILCVGVTVVVTWVLMPRLMPLFRDWLNPPPPENGAARVAAPPPRWEPHAGPGTPVPAGDEAPQHDWRRPDRRRDEAPQHDWRPHEIRRRQQDRREDDWRPDRPRRYRRPDEAPEQDWRQEAREPERRRYEERMPDGRRQDERRRRDEQWPQYDPDPRRDRRR